MTNPIILADGVFDPLHDRHVDYLRQAQSVDSDCKLVVQVSPQTKRAEWLNQVDRAAVVGSLRVVRMVTAYRTTLEALQALVPRYYVKGADWQWQGVSIPAAEHSFCMEQGVHVHYVDTGEQRSSTALLRGWADLEAWRGVDRFEVDAHAQRAVAFNPAAQGYDDFAARSAIEGRHPDILADLCRGKTVLDVGCGPGYLVRLLRERAVKARGIDPHLSGKVRWCRREALDWQAPGDEEDIGQDYADVVVCREVLEHIPVREWGAFLHHLFRVATDRVYLTTRFTQAPAHPFELTDELAADPSHITCLPQPFVRALCVLQGGTRDLAWEQALDWQHKGRVLVYKVAR